MQFGFMSRCGAAKAIFSFERVAEELFSEKKMHLYFALIDLEKAF